MDIDAESLIKLGNNLFSKRTGFISLLQEIADNFYPERADFTMGRSMGSEFGQNLMSSFPILTRRDLGNSIGTMLRPTSKDWARMTINDESRLTNDGRRWLEWATKLHKSALYSRTSMFVRATKEGDHDYAAFGQTVISVERNRLRNGLLFRCWHLRDVAWAENENGVVDTVFRRWKPTTRDILKIFGDKAHQTIKDKIRDGKDQFEEHECWHVVIPSEGYRKDGKEYRTPFISVYLDVANKHIMECVGSWTLKYVIPRWQTVSGSQYAFSPATITALPDARLIQSMTRVILEAGEKAVDPPMLAIEDAIRGDVSVYAGGITWADSEYDQKLSDVLRPISTGGNIPVGIEMLDRTQEVLTEAFYLNKLTLPQPGDEMTAYEVGQRVQEYIRQAMPIFEPIESEYNGAICEMAFEEMLRGGAFGSLDNLPEELTDEEITFKFESPLHDAVERAKGQRFLEAASMITQAVAMDPSTKWLVDAKVAMRDVLTGIGIPAAWTRGKGEVDQMEDQERAKQEAAQFLQLAQQGADVGATIGANAAIPTP